MTGSPFTAPRTWPWPPALRWPSWWRYSSGCAMTSPASCLPINWNMQARKWATLFCTCCCCAANWGWTWKPWCAASWRTASGDLLVSDRHFDQLATRFAEKIYGGAKGAIRLAVLQADLTETLPKRPLRVLDIGAGLGHMALWLAEQGHEVTLAEPAEPMLEGARQRFTDAGQTATFIQAPWQALPEFLSDTYDLVLCHAVLEWLAEPHTILPVLRQLTEADGWLSLAFYNRDALIYRNLLKGHFRKMRKNDMAGEKQSLTPQQPLDPRELETQLEGLWQVQTRSGVRVFHDYMPVEFQARADLTDLLEMELAHRRHPAFAGLGRYLHWMCRPV
ncbi:SmtA protein [Pseudomonas cannabina]|uniref:tRNA 5-carboxymethoxyuridine methyltransferase n=1 Tax=Pseudomonas cannabina TaxID=86840 RepID=A0AB37Q7N3_PSECA|nr:SmtA protein [Pseudomonas cannabina]